MSLDTILTIGKALRESDNWIKHFSRAKSCLREADAFYITLPVKENYSIDWSKARITPEKETDQLYYLDFKTSESDTSGKFLYGDIYHKKVTKISKTGEIEVTESGNYKLYKGEKSSFEKAIPDYDDILKKLREQAEDTTLEESSISSQTLQQFEKMRGMVGNNQELIEKMLLFPSSVKYYFSEAVKTPLEELLRDDKQLLEFSVRANLAFLSDNDKKALGISSDVLDEKQREILSKVSNCTLFIHFEYPGSTKHWYQFEGVLSAVDEKMIAEYTDSTFHGLVLKKTLYKTLCSGDKKNDIQFPGFSLVGRYKSQSFQQEGIRNLFFALEYAKRGKRISGTDVKVIVLPRGENLTAEDYESFLETESEAQLIINNNPPESIFQIDDDLQEKVTSFDLIFCKQGGVTSPDKDLIEISGIQKSKLRQIKDRIDTIAKQVYEEREKEVNTEKGKNSLKPIYLTNAFRQILENNGNKYESHLLRTLPLIYTESYYNDGQLLPAFIQNIEFSVRNGEEKSNRAHFKQLKFYFIFLQRIRNTKTDNYMQMTNSESYQIGLLLGLMARNLNTEINSFEKSYVGILTRRIGTLQDLICFKNDVVEKLVLHDKMKYVRKHSCELDQKIKELREQYDKEICAFGFFESYFSYNNSTKETSEEENV